MFLLALTYIWLPLHWVADVLQSKALAPDNVITLHYDRHRTWHLCVVDHAANEIAGVLQRVCYRAITAYVMQLQRWGLHWAGYSRGKHRGKQQERNNVMDLHGAVTVSRIED